MILILVVDDFDGEVERVTATRCGALGPQRRFDATAAFAVVFLPLNIDELVVHLDHVDHLRPRVVSHQIKDDKGKDTFIGLVGEYQGTIVCDALKTHEAGARDSPGVQLAACWAHVFRKFKEAEADHPEAGLATRWIGELYEIDAKAGNNLELRAELRRTESTHVLEKLKTWLWSQALLKTLSIGKAAGYAIANWERLKRFTEDPRIPLDNNATERGIRGPVVGRKNHYGSKSRRGTIAAATLYSLIETAKLHGVNPATYLREAVLASRRGEVLLPWQLAN